MIFNMMQTNLNRAMEKMVEDQEKVSSMKKINKISDNPIDAGKIYDFTSALNKIEQFERNVSYAQSIGALQDKTLQSASDILTRIKELAVSQAGSANATAQTRRSAALEIISLRQELLDDANTKLGARYIFSGFADRTKAFSDYSSIIIPSPTNVGSPTIEASVTIPIEFNNHSYKINFISSSTFDLIDTTTGTTIYTNQSFSSGDEIRFAGIVLKIVNSPTAPVAGDSFDFSFTLPGAYHGDSGISRVELEDSDFIQINLTGEQVFKGVGVDSGMDIFGVVNDLIEALKNDDTSQIQDSLEALDTSSQQILDHLAIVGARTNLYDSIQQRLEDQKYTFELLKSNYEDVDLAEAITELTKSQTAYQAALGTSAKISQLSLLDFLK